MQKACIGCETLFTPTKDRKLYCSYECFRKCLRKPKVIKNCPICGKEYSHIPSKPKKSCSRSCSNKLMHQQKGHNVGSENRLCLNCWDLFVIPAVRRKEKADFCSIDCKNEYHREIVPCTYCGDPVVKPKSRTSYEHSFCSNEHRLLWLNGERTEPSGAELKTIQILDELGIPYEFQYPFGAYLLDFAIVSEKIDLEIDSEYHHSLPDRIPKDKRRDYYVKEHGWKVVRIPSQQVSAEKIIESLDKIGYTCN